MKGDFTRFTFAPSKHYDAVLTQQGRVQTDADWNEQVMIAAHRDRTAMGDIIGPTGVPQDLLLGGMGPFLVYWGPDAQNVNQLFINQGRYYADGLVAESEAPVQYTQQIGATLPPAEGAGIYIFYIDLWRRHITSLEDPDLREVALAGADSGTRSQLVWQIRAQPVGALGDDIDSIPASSFDPPWQPADTERTGTMDAKAGSAPLENQLYRVEIHRGGTAAVASCKWSRDNGTVVARVLAHTAPVAAQVIHDNVPVDVWQLSIDIDRNSRDSFSSFLPGHMVELGNDPFVLLGKPGVFGAITAVVGDTLTLEVPRASAPLDSSSAILNPLLGATSIVRRWDNLWNPDDAVDATLVNVGPDYTTVGGRLILESDVSVKFASGGGDLYRTGDYWLVPARTVSGLVDWVVNVPQPAVGEAHVYAPLALVRVEADGTIANPPQDIRDMRKVFPTLRSLGGSGGGIVTGTGTMSYVPKWQASNASVVINSKISDDGTTVSIEDQLKVGTVAAAATITRFTSEAIQNLSSADLAATVPTAQAVKSFMNDSVPPGTVMAYASESIPAGWLECNGASLDGDPGGPTPQYTALFTAIQKAFGEGNGSPQGFNVPDLRGRFIRGWANGSGADPDRTSRTASSAGGRTGDRVGSLQSDQFASHSHLVSVSGTAATALATHSHSYYAVIGGDYRYDLWYGFFNGYAIVILYGASPSTSNSNATHDHSVNVSGVTETSGGSESRPRNVYLTYIIKF